MASTLTTFRLQDIIPSQEALSQMGRRRYQQPSVFKTRGGRPEWFFRARVDVLVTNDETKGTARREQVYYLGYADEIGKREAEKRRDEILAAVVNRPQVSIPSQVKFADVIAAYRRDHLPSLRETTQRQQGQALSGHFDKSLGALRMCDIDARSIQQWLSGMSLAYRTKKQYLGLLRTLWNKAEEWGFVQHSFPKGSYTCGVKRDVKGREMPPVEQLRRMLAILADPYRAMAEVALYSGLRISEIRGLKWGDIENGRLTIRRRISQQNGVDVPKTGAARRVFDIRPMAAVFSRLPRKDEWIFNHSGVSYESCRYALSQAAEKAGVKVKRFNWHHLRAICNTLLSHGGAETADRQALLGHTTEAMNTVYLLQADQDVKRRGELLLAVQAVIMGETRGVQ